MGEDLIPGPGRAHVGEYAVVERLGTDRNAECFRARRGVLRTDVLIRILNQELATDSVAAERIQVKAEAALGLRHPNLVPLLDYGWDGGRFFWVSEWTEARRLDVVLRDEGFLGADAAVEVALDVTLALKEAHALGLVHGDIAPATVLLTPAWDAKLADLGIAATSMAPDPHPGASDDVYSVGLLLGEMLTGSTLGGAPTGADPLGGRPLSPVAPSAINPDVPREIDDIVLRTLASDPSERYTTAEALHSALSAWRQTRLEGMIWGEDDPFFGADASPSALSPLDGPPAPDSLSGAGAAPPDPTLQRVEWEASERPSPTRPEAALPGAPGIRAKARVSEETAESTVAVILRRVLLAAALILFIDTVYVVASLPFALGTARAQLDQGARELRSGNYRSADDHFVRALDSSNRAVGVTRHPPFLLLASLPWLQRDPSAMAGMAEGTRLAALAGVASSRGFIEMGAPDGGPVAAVFRSGSVRLRALRAGEPFFARSRNLLDQSLAALKRAPEPNLGFLARQLSSERVAVAGAQATLAKFGTVAGLLPSLTGLGTERRYLFVVQSLSQARGTGGVIEHAGVLSAANGDLSIQPIRPIESLPPPPSAVSGAPDWFVREYGRWGSLSDYSAVNFSPRFASVAPVLLDLFAASTGEQLDGVIAIDSAALGGLAPVTGPVIAAGAGSTAEATGAARLLDRELLADGGDAERDEVVTEAVGELWRRLDGAGADLGALPSSLSDLAAEGHLRVYSRGEDDQSALDRLGLTGDPGSVATNVQAVVHNNLSATPVDGYLKKSTNTKVQLTNGPEAAVFTTVTLENGADPGTAGWLAAYGSSGLNRMRLTWLLPKGAIVHELKVGAEAIFFDERDEGGYPAISQVIEVPGGSTRRASIAYSMTAAAGDADAPSFDLTLWPQPAVEQGPTTATVVPPPGAEIAPGGPGELSGDGELTVTQPSAAPLELHLELLPD